MSKKIPAGRSGPAAVLRPDLDRPLDSRAAVRAWLVDGGSPDARTTGGEPAWAVVMDQAPTDAIDELINAGADLNVRGPDGQGWLLRALARGVEPWLVIAGLRRLGPSWWKPDPNGISPFHDARLPLPVAQAMGIRWWTEGRTWDLLVQNGLTPTQSAARAQRDDLVKVWRLWSGRSLFAGRRGDVHRPRPEGDAQASPSPASPFAPATPEPSPGG